MKTYRSHVHDELHNHLGQLTIRTTPQPPSGTDVFVGWYGRHQVDGADFLGGGSSSGFAAHFDLNCQVFSDHAEEDVQDTRSEIETVSLDSTFLTVIKKL